MNNSVKFLEFLRIAAWSGLVYGFIEAIESGLLSLIPGALSWRTGNSAEVFWFAPVFYMVTALLLSLAIALTARLVRFRRPDIVLIVAIAFGGGYLAARLQGQVFSVLTSLILATGIGVVAFRIYRRWETPLRRFMRRSLPALLGAVVLLAIGTTVAPRLKNAGPGSSTATASNATNVLLLVLDTQRADHMSTYGYERTTTPNIDSLARSSTVFENATASSSWTLPTHATLMTGVMPQQHRAGAMRRPFLDKRYPTLAEVLSRRGYATGGFVANTYWCGRQTGLNRGFSHYEDFYGTPGDAFVRTVLGRWLAYDIFPRFGLSDIPGRKRAPAMNRNLLAWIDRNAGKPFFAFVNYFDVHSPLLPPKPYAGRFSGRRAEDYRSGREINIGALTAGMRLPPDSVLQALVDGYDESLLSLDAALGELFAELDRRGILGRTLVIITSDHGESFGDHNFVYHGQSLYRDQTHVPLLIRLPGQVPAGLRADWPVGLEQIPRTVMTVVDPGDSTFAGIPLFTATGNRQVLSVLPQRAGLPAEWPTSKGTVAAVTTARWHFIQTQDGTSELYDITSDPSELNNLFHDPSFTEVIEALRGGLDREMNGSGLGWSTP